MEGFYNLTAKDILFVDAEITSNTSSGFTLDSFLTFINQHHLDLKQEATLLAVSGGVDSLVMVNLFHKMGFRAGVAHCNFGLREEESEEDERFVQSVAENCGFEFFSKRFDVKVFAKNKSVSTQMAAREMRYAWFEEVRKSNNYHWIATAHHANDSFETVLLNLARGTGLPGLHGISGVSNHLMRPLIYASKEKILKFALDNHLAWREDRSNNSDDYKRNLIRHKVTPIFQQINPSLEVTFTETSQRLSAADKLLDEFLQIWKTGAVRIDQDLTKISIKDLLAASEPKYRLWFVLKDYGFAYRQLDQIMESLKGIAGKTFTSNSHMLLVDRDELILKEKTPASASGEWTVSGLDSVFLFEDRSLRFERGAVNADIDILRENKYLYADAEKLQFPLTIRKWQNGDAFYPFGMNGRKKKLSDLLTDVKLDRFEKEKIRLLVNGNGDIIWVIGIRADDRYKITSQSKEMFVAEIVTPGHF